MTQVTYEQYLAQSLSPLIDYRFREAFQRVHGPSYEEADKETIKSMLKLVHHFKRAYHVQGNGMIMLNSVQAAERYVNIDYVDPAFLLKKE